MRGARLLITVCDIAAAAAAVEADEPPGGNLAQEVPLLAVSPVAGLLLQHVIAAKHRVV